MRLEGKLRLGWRKFFYYVCGWVILVEKIYYIKRNNIDEESLLIKRFGDEVNIVIF